MPETNQSTLHSTEADVDNHTVDPGASFALTILHHPDGARIGQHASLNALQSGLPLAISRSEPLFGPRPRQSLGCARVSRTPLWIQRSGDTLHFTPGSTGLRVQIDGQPLGSQRTLSDATFDQHGALIELGGRVLLWLHRDQGNGSNTEHGLIGVSASIAHIRRAIERLGTLSAAVLIRGESGVGKELVARAVHRRSTRVDSPFITVNMAAVPASMAAAEFFGHGRGAFTGATAARAGWFEQANGGTLFLDEIGETPGEIQPQLLRALDSGEIQPVGQASRTVNVRLISATDADLEALVAAGSFRRALYYRLQSTTLEVPPLRLRTVDIPLLLHHFLREELRNHSAEDRLTERRGERPWLSLALVRTLMQHDFPGNVRELKNIAVQMALDHHEAPTAALPHRLTRKPPESETERPSSPSPPTESGIRDALRANQWNVARAASALGIAKNTLVAAIARNQTLHLAKDLDEQTIRDALDDSGTLPEAAERLEVSAHGLRLRMRTLGIPRTD